MDETLIHTFSVIGNKIEYSERPYCREFLAEMSKYYEIVIFTAGLAEYADEILDMIDPEKKHISYRLYR